MEHIELKLWWSTAGWLGTAKDSQAGGTGPRGQLQLLAVEVKSIRTLFTWLMRVCLCL